MYLPDRSLCPDADRKYECAAFTLESLIAWLETKAPEGKYSFECEDGGCLFGQYMALMKMEWSYPEGYKAALDKFGHWYAVQKIASEYPRNFGSALSRARKYVAGTP